MNIDYKRDHYSIVVLFAGIAVYNEEENMVPCLDLMKDIIDGVCLVDGLYFGYPDKHFLSTDNTVNLAAGWCESSGKEFKAIYYG
ncbi:hypothetical protein LCGC14_2953980, partial [marine sediment metagenome]